MTDNLQKYWNCPKDSLLASLQSAEEGLSEEEAARRLDAYGPNRLQAGGQLKLWILFFKQFNSPITLILVFAAVLSFFLGDKTDASIILIIIFISTILSFFQERGAAVALARLLSIVQITGTVLRAGTSKIIPIETMVCGDVVILSAGNTVPGDCRLLASNNLFVDEAALTGETFPAEKKCAVLPDDVGLAARINCVFMGTHVISGTAKVVVVKTATATEFGKISEHLRKLKPETEFEREMKHFGVLLMEVTLVLVALVFFINISLHKPVLESFLFSLAIAVGLTPQLLPAIISINLSKGASQMAKRHVIVKRLPAIENFGSMNVFCSDKTGTLTQGKIKLSGATDFEGNASEKVFRMAYINAHFETGFANPIDEAIRNVDKLPLENILKTDEIPYDFIRKRLSVLVNDNGKDVLVSKGAVDEMLSICRFAEDSHGLAVDLDAVRSRLNEQIQRHCAEGFRVIAVAYKPFNVSTKEVSKADEKEMVFLGILLLFDPPKKDAAEAVQKMKQLGVSLKIITGDNPLTAKYISEQVGMKAPRIITGDEIRDMSTGALIRRAPITDVFAAVEPNQKERILTALKRAGNVVGFMGDGINDAPALHIADVGISVNGAADVAKDAADIVLLSDDLNVLQNGIVDGRKIFANTLKYIFMATSANFGNMFSMAGSSLLLSFLPLLPKQVLLVNMLTDIPEMTIATDSVDSQMVDKPSKMNLRFIKKFMIVFGLISSLFDYATFFVLLYIIKSDKATFRTGWFVESVVSAALIVLIIRTSRAVWKSKPGKYLSLATVAVVILAMVIPEMPFAHLLGFTRLPLALYGWICLIILAYMVITEVAKRIFYRSPAK